MENEKLDGNPQEADLVPSPKATVELISQPTAEMIEKSFAQNTVRNRQQALKQFQDWLQYCHRKFGPLSKTRLWYNIHLLERSLRWRNENEETSRPSFRSEVVLEALSGESSQAEVCGRTP